MIIFLIGMMGSGKSSIGAQLAKGLEIDFFDLDEVISLHAGSSIAQIFEKEGEKFFRELEKEMLQGFKKEEDLVLACGGGTPCFYNNMDWMLANGIVLYLKIPVETLTERLSQTDVNDRPLLSDSTRELTNRLESLLESRKAYYEKAHFEVNADQTQQEVLADLIFYLKRFKKGF
ncbi:MAG: shikimate kinase [Saprospiraceae bacterium]